MIIYDTPQTKNPCFQRARPMRPVGILVHSTGANNPWMKRYVDAPAVLGVNPNGNHWNKESATKCMHAFIGKDLTGRVAVAQTLPYKVASWGCGSGPNGSYNRDPTGHIQFEICEDGLNNEAYYREAFGVAEEYCATLCQQYGIPASAIVGHYEAAQRGYASNHADPRHWMRRFGDSMDAFRARVAARIGQNITGETEGIGMILSRGSKGEEVRKVQQFLMYWGHDLGKWGADGNFGAQTEKAVTEFQEATGLPATGVWGTLEWAKMDEIENRPPADGPVTGTPPVIDDEPMVLVPRGLIEIIIEELNKSAVMVSDLQKYLQ